MIDAPTNDVPTSDAARRRWLALAGTSLLQPMLHTLLVQPAFAQGGAAPAGAGAAGSSPASDEAALALAFRAAVQRFTGGAPVRDGGVRLTIPQLVENGNAVPVTLAVPADAGLPPVRRLALFTQRNPQPDVAVFVLGPGAGRAEVHTRIRLATSQGLLAVAELADGSFRGQPVEVVVTMAACVEGG